VADQEGEPLDFGAMGMLDETAGAEPMAGGLGAIAEDLPAPPEAQEEEAKEEKPTLLAQIAGASPFTVMLGVSLLAILIAVVCLTLELGSYKWDIKGKEAKDFKSTAWAIPAAHCGPPTTTAAA
jgi:hypothetical protein